MRRSTVGSVVGSMCGAMVAASMAMVSPSSVPVAAAADSATSLGLTSASALVADARHGLEFVSSASDDAVVVADTAGHVVRTLTGLDGPTGMTLSPDSSTVYVAVHTGHALAAIDTDDLSVRTYDLGDEGCPIQPAVADGMVWFSQECDDGALPWLGALDPTTGTVHLRLLQGPGGELVSAPTARPHRLMSWADNELDRLEVTGGADPTARVVVRASREQPDMVLSPDGNRLFVSGGAVLNARTLGAVDSYPAVLTDGFDPGTSSTGPVALRADGAVAAVLDDPNVNLFLYPPGQTVLPRQIRAFPDDRYGLPTLQGAAFGSSDLYVLLAPDQDHPTVRLGIVEASLRAGVPTGGTTLPILGFGQVLVDPSHRRVFVAGWQGNGVAVFGAGGRLVRVLQHLPGPDQMSLTRDRRTLYVALRGGDAVAAVDTRTLAVRRLPTGVGSCPGAVVPLAGRVWFTTTCQPAGAPESLGWLDPGTGRVHLGVLRMVADRLQPVPDHPRLLLAWTRFVGGEPPGLLAVHGGHRPGARIVHGAVAEHDLVHLAVAPDGMTLASGHLVAKGTVLQSTRNLALTGLVPEDFPVVSVAVRGDGLTAAGTSVDDVLVGADDRPVPDIFLSRTATQPPVTGVRLAQRPRATLVPGGLAFGGRRLYAVVQRGFGLHLRALTMPAVHRLSVSVDRPGYVTGGLVHVVGHLDATGAAARRSVSVYSQPYGARRRTLLVRGRASVDGNRGARVRVRTNTRLLVTSRTGRRTLLSAMTVPVAVRLSESVRDPAEQTTSNDLMPAGSHPELTAHVVPAHGGQCVYVREEHWTEPRGWRAVRHPRCHRLDARSTMRYRVPEAGVASSRIRLRAEWRGDRRNAATTGAWFEVAFE